MRVASALCALALAGLAAPAAAQQQQPQPLPEPVRGEEWYRTQLVELAEVLGGSHYLRVVCEGRGDQRWRDYMRGVIQREPEYNALLVEGFNLARLSQRGSALSGVRRDHAADGGPELRARGLRVAQALSARNRDSTRARGSRPQGARARTHPRRMGPRAGRRRGRLKSWLQWRSSRPWPTWWTAMAKKRWRSSAPARPNARAAASSRCAGSRGSGFGFGDRGFGGANLVLFSEACVEAVNILPTRSTFSSTGVVTSGARRSARFASNSSVSNSEPSLWQC